LAHCSILALSQLPLYPNWLEHYRNRTGYECKPEAALGSSRPTVHQEAHLLYWAQSIQMSSVHINRTWLDHILRFRFNTRYKKYNLASLLLRALTMCQVSWLKSPFTVWLTGCGRRWQTNTWRTRRRLCVMSSVGICRKRSRRGSREWYTGNWLQPALCCLFTSPGLFSVEKSCSVMASLLFCGVWVPAWN